ncbi:MAG: VWA domain-containing protein [Anaerolineae bacterium]|nr:VWA domain-containing protein [Anaerolineae bacterium]
MMSSQKNGTLSRPQMAPSGHFFNNMLLFGRILHNAGLDINPDRMVDMVHALDWVAIGKKSDFYFVLRTLCVQRREALPVFDAAFEIFWNQFGQDMLPSVAAAEPPVLWSERPALASSSAEKRAESDSADTRGKLPVIELTPVYSRREQLATREFAAMTPEELTAARRLLSRFVWSLGTRRTRRLVVGPGPLLDVRRSVRRSLRYGGEPFELVQRRRKVKPRPLIVLADISGSMERYSRLLLHLIYSLSRGLGQKVEAFVFGTRLTRITRPLYNRDMDQALADVAQTVVDWSGGTRIGDSIKTFNQEWGKRVLRGGAVVLLISDGWDRGDPDLLRVQMERLNKSCYRLVWLNPLLGSADYEPLTRGMQAALPYVDDFLPVHNVASLEALAAHLASLGMHNRRRVHIGEAAFIGAR